MTDDYRDRERAQELAEAAGGVLEDGEAVLVRCQGQEISVAFVNPDELGAGDVDEQLLGCMLSIDQEVSDAGSVSVIGILVGTALLAILIGSGLAHPVFGALGPKLEGLWGMIGVGVLGVFSAVLTVEVLTRLAYRRRRDELLEAMYLAGLNRYQVLARLHGCEDLRQVLERLKADSGPGRFGLKA